MQNIIYFIQNFIINFYLIVRKCHNIHQTINTLIINTLRLTIKTHLQITSTNQIHQPHMHSHLLLILNMDIPSLDSQSQPKFYFLLFNFDLGY